MTPSKSSEALTANENRNNTRYYGEYQSNPTPEQLEAYFTLHPRDKELISICRFRYTKLGMAIQLCTLRFLGTFLVQPINVPEPIIAFLEQQLELSEVKLQPYLKAHATRFEHAKLIREHLEYRDFDSIAWLKVARLLYARLLIHDEKNEILFDAVTSELVEQRIVLPGATTISRFINRIRERINTRLYRELAARLTSRQAGRLEALLVMSKGATKSPLEQLRLGPTRISTPGLLAALERLEAIRVVGVSSIDLSDLAQVRLTAIAKHAMGVWAATIAKYNQQRRRGTLLALVQDLERNATDDALGIFDGIMRDIDLRAEGKHKRHRLRTLGDLDESALRLVAGYAPVLDETISPESLRDAIFAIINRDALEKARSSVSSLAIPLEDIEPQRWEDAHGRISGFIIPLLNAMRFEGAPSAKGLLEAMTWLRKTSGTSSSSWGEAPRDFVPKRWLNRVFPEGVLNRKTFVVCVAHQLHKALKTRNVFVNRSYQHSDPRGQLLDLTAWEKAKPDVLRALDLPDKPKVMLERLSKTLDAVYKRVEQDLNENPHVALKDVNGVLMPVLSPVKALIDSPSLKTLQQDVEQRLPEIDLSELILEINARTGFVREIIASSEGLPRAADLETSVVAVLVAEACNLNLKQVAQEGTPALTLSRLAQVKQNYLRANGVTEANARLVEYHASLPLAQRWGGGEVASADGLRFVVPVRSIHTAPNAKYFGVQRGITYYTLTSDQHSMLHGMVVPGTLRDSLFILATVLEQRTNLNPTEIMTDTAGYSDVVFGLFHLLGYRFSPRLADIGSSRYWRMNRKAKYGKLDGIARNQIDEKQIAHHWDDILRLVGSLKLGAANAVDVMRVLARDGSLSGLGKAVQEVGRVAKTLYLLEYLGDESYRRRIHTQLNRGELRGRVARWVLHGNKGQIKKKYRAGMELQLGALGLVVNVITLWNTLYAQAALNLLEAMGDDLHEEDVARLSPLKWRHINVLGRFDFQLLESVEGGDLRPLRDPNAMTELELAWLNDEE